MSREPILGYSRKQGQNRHRARGKIPKQYKREANKPLWAVVTNQSAKKIYKNKAGCEGRISLQESSETRSGELRSRTRND
jgi:hypothetical protein